MSKDLKGTRHPPHPHLPAPPAGWIGCVHEHSEFYFSHCRHRVVRPSPGHRQPVLEVSRSRWQLQLLLSRRSSSSKHVFTEKSFIACFFHQFIIIIILFYFLSNNISNLEGRLSDSCENGIALKKIPFNLFSVTSLCLHRNC